MDANQNLTAEMIKIDPYNYTLSEMVDVIGETEAKKLFKSIYKSCGNRTFLFRKAQQKSHYSVFAYSGVK